MNVIASARDSRAALSLCLFFATVSPSLCQASKLDSLVDIEGAPPTIATPGTPYSFQPRVTGSGEKTFIIRNRPDWAVFSYKTGRLSGVPTDADIGKVAYVKIIVSNDQSSATLPAFPLEVKPVAPGDGSKSAPSPDSITLSWDPPTLNTDGSPLSNLSGYRIYSGAQLEDLKPRATVANPGLSRFVLEPLAAGERYFAIAALTPKGIESALSEVVEHAASK